MLKEWSVSTPGGETVFYKESGFRCPYCPSSLLEVNEPEEVADGNFLGFLHYECSTCKAYVASAWVENEDGYLISIPVRYASSR